MPADHNGGRTRWRSKKPKARGRNKLRARKQSARPESTLEIIDRHLLEVIEITFNDEPTRMPALAAIIFQLSQKERALDARASRVLLKYQGLVKPAVNERLKLEFVEDKDVGALGIQSPEDDRG